MISVANQTKRKTSQEIQCVSNEFYSLPRFSQKNHIHYQNFPFQNSVTFRFGLVFEFGIFFFSVFCCCCCFRLPHSSQSHLINFTPECHRTNKRKKIAQFFHFVHIFISRTSSTHTHLVQKRQLSNVQKMHYLCMHHKIIIIIIS